MIKAVGLAVSAALLSLAPHAWTPKPTAQPESVEQLESGVWWVGQPKAAPALPPPKQVPANGLWVSSTTAGTIALSAVRFTVGPDDRQPILSIPIDSATTLPPEVPLGVTVNVAACPTMSSWKPPAKGTFGALGAAPKYDCGKGQVLGALSIDGKTMVFELTQFVTGTDKTISVVLAPTSVPAPIPAAPVALPVSIPTVLIAPTFDVTFKPVTTNAIEVLTSLPLLEDQVLGVQTDETPRLDAAPAAATAAPVATVAAAKLSRPKGLAALPGQVAQAATNVVHKGDSARTRTLAAVVFFDLCLWAWWVSSRDPLPGMAQAGRPYRTLYDGAESPAVVTRLRLTRSPREGKPPPLR